MKFAYLFFFLYFFVWILSSIFPLERVIELFHIIGIDEKIILLESV